MSGYESHNLFDQTQFRVRQITTKVAVVSLRIDNETEIKGFFVIDSTLEKFIDRIKLLNRNLLVYLLRTYEFLKLKTSDKKNIYIRVEGNQLIIRVVTMKKRIQIHKIPFAELTKLEISSYSHLIKYIQESSYIDILDDFKLWPEI